MKVLQVIASVSTLRGGTSTALANFATACNRSGVTTDVVTTDDNGPGQRLSVSCGKFSDAFGGRIIYFERQTEFYSVSMSMLKWLRSHAGDYDLIHVHGLFNFSAVAAAWSARSAKRPFVLTPHGTLDRWGRENRRPHFKRCSIALLESRILRAAATVHFTSERERLQAHEIDVPFNSEVIPLGIDLSKHDQLKITSRPTDLHESIGKSPTVLFMSRIDWMKGLDELLDAFHDTLMALPDALLVIAGDGDPELIRLLKARIANLGIANSVHWLGFVSGDKKSWLLNNCSLFVLPSKSENFGLAVVEAMAFRLPVIVAPGVPIGDLIQRVGAGEVSETTRNKLSATLISWLQDKPRSIEAGNAGHALAHDEMSLDTFGRRLAHLYSSIVNDHQRTNHDPVVSRVASETNQ